jgi:MFS family permease
MDCGVIQKQPASKNMQTLRGGINMEETNLNEASWSWAAQISSYQFWGLTVYFILFMTASNYIFSGSIFPFLRDILRDTVVQKYQISTLFSVKTISSLFGFLFAWIAIRTKGHYILFLYGIVVLLGISFVSFSNNVSLIFLGASLIGLGAGSVAITIPSMIAGGRGGADMYVVAFGIMTVFNIISGMSSMPAASFLLYKYMSPKAFFLILAVPIIIGMLFLIPINSKLFNESPPSRGIPFPPVRRDPWIVALLCFVPFYFMYWLYRLHGEIRSFTESSKLLSSKAAVGGCFVPFLLPMILATLNDCMNVISSSQISKEQRATWVIVLWSILFCPVSVALLQSDINKLIQGQIQE